MRGVLRACFVAVFATFGAGVAAQQQQDQTLVLPSPIMVVDFERVFAESLYGKRISDALNAERERVQTENDRLAEELLAEESALTSARATMSVADFRAAADAFDERAQAVRASRDAEQSRLVNLRDTERDRFIERIQPLIATMMVERGAVVAMDRRAVLRALGSANATEDAIARINATLGDGTMQPSERPTLRPNGPEDNGFASPVLPVPSDDLSAPD